MFAWDAAIYWNHRIQHEARYLWAIPRGPPLERALQPVHRAAPAGLSSALGTFVPYGLMALLGIFRRSSSRPRASA
ncbi:MAG: hypothetical protein R2716_03110 [Microthrixaceae bacterium]